MGATLLFGAPVALISSFHYWPQIGLFFVVLGLVLLIWGAGRITLSARQVARERKVARAQRIRGWTDQIADARAQLQKLKYWRSVAESYGDELRLSEIDVDIRAQEGRIESAANHLDIEKAGPVDL